MVSRHIGIHFCIGNIGVSAFFYFSLLFRKHEPAQHGGGGGAGAADGMGLYGAAPLLQCLAVFCGQQVVGSCRGILGQGSGLGGRIGQTGSKAFLHGTSKGRGFFLQKAGGSLQCPEIAALGAKAERGDHTQLI